LLLRKICQGDNFLGGWLSYISWIYCCQYDISGKAWGIVSLLTKGSFIILVFIKSIYILKKIITGVFVFGAFILMVFVDVTKMMTGRLRPNFLELCKINKTACRLNNNQGDDSMCLEKDEMVIKHARYSSFLIFLPYIHAYMSVFWELNFDPKIIGAFYRYRLPGKIEKKYMTRDICLLQ
jgi:hypothetical protein